MTSASWRVSAPESPLIESPYYQLTLSTAKRFVRAVRSSAAFPSVEAYDLTIAQLAAALLGVDRRNYVLLIDARKAPFRNDPAYEAANLRFRGVVVHGFRKMAVLLASHAGVLQIERHARKFQSGPAVFLQEQEALRYLGV
jgi:hypothetical protein